MVKIDLITGFLGSGKTTFIRKYAQYLMDAGNNIGILENDYTIAAIFFITLSSSFSAVYQIYTTVQSFLIAIVNCYCSAYNLYLHLVFYLFFC